jgi:hypothetical protein
MMPEGIQTFFAEAGESACYVLAIIKIAERLTQKSIDPIITMIEAIDKGEIHYNYTNKNDDDNFFVKKPESILNRLTGETYILTKESPLYITQPGDQIVQRWERKKTGVTTGHFRLADWDSLYDSQTVKYGEIVSLRVFHLV